MKKSVYFFTVLFLAVFTILNIAGCKKDDSETTVDPNVPLLKTEEITHIVTNSALCKGLATDDHGFEVTEVGICWSKNQSPTINDFKTVAYSPIPGFILDISDLSPTTTYYVRAYAINSKGTGYGNEVTFTTLNDDPAITLRSLIFNKVKSYFFDV